MGLYTVTSNTSFADIVSAALKTQTRVFDTANDAIAALLSGGKPKSRILIVDLLTIDDAARLIDFVKSSPPVSDTVVIAAGTECHFRNLDHRTCDALGGILYPPFTATELALIVASLAVGLDTRAAL